MLITGSTRVYAILGSPVAHSLSPVMQNAAFRALGLDAVYVPMRCDVAELGALMRTLAGGNVTVPFKAEGAKLVERQVSVSVAVAGHTPPISDTDTDTVTGICNTFWTCDGQLKGAETDSGAIVTVLDQLGASGKDWLVLGTGGSAHAALLAAKRTGARVAVRSRSADRAQAFERLAESLGVQRAADSEPDVVLNCTPLGLQDHDALPLEPARVPERAVALDLVYRRGETAWVRALRGLGRQAADGRMVLLEQGAAAFEHWFPDRRAPREVMRAAVRSALE